MLYLDISDMIWEYLVVDMLREMLLYLFIEETEWEKEWENCFVLYVSFSVNV
jgi:hypothetical protein